MTPTTVAILQTIALCYFAIGIALSTAITPRPTYVSRVHAIALWSVFVCMWPLFVIRLVRAIR